MPVIGMGTAVDPWNYDPAAIKEAILEAVKAGYRHFDTAGLYKSEPYLGEALAKALKLGLVSRDELFVTTKLWAADAHSGLVIPALKKSLQDSGITMGSCFRKHSSSSIHDDKDKEENPVVVELFSSLGDASSPEAERLFSQVGRGDFDLEMPVILLAYHVDYCNHMGWKDPFGSSLWTVRQKDYKEALQLNNLFTPQAVIQGKSQCMANVEDKLLSGIKSSARYPGLAFQATFERPSKDKLEVFLTGHLRSKIDSVGVNINVALYENGLVTEVENGPNIGLDLATDYVVRKLEKLCFVKDITAKQTVSGTLKFNLWEGFDSSKCGIAVFLQDDYLYIFGSQNIKLPDNIEAPISIG